MTKRRGSRGFTLVELGVVIVIIGILAVIALVGYRKIINSSKLTEAKHMLGAIRIAEEGYKADNGDYLNLGGIHCPSDGMTEARFAFDNPACNGGQTAQLGIHVDGPVRFGYAVWAGNTVAQPGGVPVNLLDLSSWSGVRTPYYVIHAQADLDPLDSGGLKTELATSSLNPSINSINDGY